MPKKQRQATCLHAIKSQPAHYNGSATFRDRPLLHVSPALRDGRARITPKGWKVEMTADGRRIIGKLFRATHARLVDALLDADAGWGLVTREGRRFAVYL